MSDWKVKLTALGWKKGSQTDRYAAMTVSTDDSAKANAAAEWRLAGGAHSKELSFKSAGKGRGGARF